MGLGEIYESMIEEFKRIGRLGQIAGLLHWDQQVNMPPKGIEARSEQLAMMQGMIHGRITDPKFVEALGELDAAKDKLDEDQAVNVREIKHEVDKLVKVPRDLVEEISRHTAKSSGAWVEARKNSDFGSFAPYLERMVELKIREAKAKGAEGESVYDTMLDDFEKGMNEQKTAEILEDLRGRLVPFIHRVLDAPPPEVPPLTERKWPIQAQREFGLKLIRDIGFDFEGGRQDISAHPFCTGELGDVRITTRFYDNDPRPSLFGMLHESGHALYEQGVDPAHLLTPLGSSVSLGVHESQSRMWENLVGRSLAFWKTYYPDLQAAFPEALDGVPMEGFHRFVNQIKGSLIRVEADEATYNLHIVLRFEIERDLIGGSLAVSDLPAAWNAKMKEYLDVEVPDDAQGVLQDVHWSEGYFGYFPTYSLGNLFSAQLFEAAGEAIGDLPAKIEHREFAPLLEWLRENVHRKGKRHDPRELVRLATGREPSAEALMNYLEAKFAPIYGL